MNEPGHRLTTRRAARWETRDGRFTLSRRDGEWYASPRSLADRKALRATGVKSSSFLGFWFGLGLHATAEVLASIVGSDPRVRWKRSSAYLVDADGEPIPYYLLHVARGWQAVHVPLGRMKYTPVGSPQPTRTDALDALAILLTSSSEASA